MGNVLSSVQSSIVCSVQCIIVCSVQCSVLCRILTYIADQGARNITKEKERKVLRGWGRRRRRRKLWISSRKTRHGKRMTTGDMSNLEIYSYLLFGFFLDFF